MVSHATAQDVQRRIEVSASPVYVVAQGKGMREPGLKRVLDRVAGVSGGRAFYTDSVDELDSVFTEIGDDIAAQYLLAYAPSELVRDDGWRTIRVEVAVEARGPGARGLPRDGSGEVTMRGSIALAALLAASLPAAAQQPEAVAQPPVFGVGVDLVAVDASVVDEDGRPVLGLGPEDFRIRVDGKPRRILTVEYLGRDLEPPASQAPRPAHFSSNEDAPRGRLILLVVDRGNIGHGGGRQVLKAADRFLDTLAPADRIGLVFVPGPGPRIEFTPDLDLVRRGLRGVVGQAQRGGYQVPLSEALALIKDDETRWAQFVDLSCGVYKIAQQVEACRVQMEAEANQVFLDYRERSLASQRALAAVLRSLREVEGPKTVVLISEGLGTEGTWEVRDLAGLAAEAQVTLFVLLLNTSTA